MVTHRNSLRNISPFQGQDAESAMQRLCANNMAVEPGQVVYTGMLNGRGGFQTDCTVTRLGKDK